MTTGAEHCEIGRDSLGTSTAQRVLLITASSYISICPLKPVCQYIMTNQTGRLSHVTAVTHAATDLGHAQERLERSQSGV